MRRLRAEVIGVVAVACSVFLTGVLSARDRPLAVSPGSGSGTTIAGACPAFSWGAVAGAQSYELVAYQVPDGSSSTASPGDLKELWRVTVPGSARSWTPAAAQCFAYGGRYAWAVRAVRGARPGAWSKASLFRVERAPTAEELRAAMATIRRYLAGARGSGTGSPSGEAWTRANPRAVDGAADGATGEIEARPAGTRSLTDTAPISTAQKILSAMPKASATPALGTPSLAVDANLALSASSNVFKDGGVFLWDDGANLALGRGALASDTSGTGNTALGTDALAANSGGANAALGSYNTAVGFQALAANTIAHSNTAVGYQALMTSSTGGWNSAVGSFALRANTTGQDNAALGVGALGQNTAGSNNTGMGMHALDSNTTGTGNTATGFEALFSNDDGYGNTGIGDGALTNNTSGYYNTAIGFNALSSNTGGTYNIAVGYEAGSAITTGSGNILIGNNGTSSDSTTTRIGAGGVQTSAFIAGIVGTTTGNNDAVAVMIDSAGQLGTVSSSRAVKQDIEDVGEASDRLYELRPVSFRYKKYVKEAVAKGEDPSELPRTYGLIAEEVANVFPDLVVYGKDGKPKTIKYRLLAPLLLNELQKEHWRAIEAETDLGRLRQEVTAERARLAELSARDAARAQRLARLEAELLHFETRSAQSGGHPVAPAPAPASGNAASRLQR